MLKSPLRAVLALLGLRPNEFSRVWAVALSYAALLASLYVLKPARNALFLQGVGVERLPLALLAIAIAGALVAHLLARGAARLALPKTAPFLLLGAVLLFFARLFLDWSSTTVVFCFYGAVNLFGQFATSLIWLWATTSFDAREARRVFSFIAAAGILGAFAGGAFTHQLVGRLGTLDLLWPAVAKLLLAGVSLYGAPYSASRARNVQQPEPSMLSDMKRTPLVRLLAESTLIAATVSALVDLQFNSVVEQFFPGRDEKTAFFGGLFAWLNAAAFLFQLLFSSRLLSRIGVAPALLLLPLSLTLASLGILFFPLLPMAVALKSADVGLRHSLYRSVVEVLFVPLPTPLRRRARVFLDATFDNLGTGIGACLGFALIGQGQASVALATLLALLLWFWVTVRLRPAYLAELHAGFARREIHPAELHVEVADRAQRELLINSLQQGSTRQIRYALEVLNGVRAADLVDPLCGLLRHADAVVRCEALQLLARQPDVLARQADVLALLHDEDRAVREVANVVLIELSPGPSELAEQYLDSDDPERWHAALSAIAGGVVDGGLRAEHIAKISAADGDEAAHVREALVLALAKQGASQNAELIRQLARANEPQVLRAAVLALGELRDEKWVPWFLTLLAEPRFRVEATRALANYGAALHVALTRQLRDGPREARERACRVFRQMGDRSAAQCLFDVTLELAPPDQGPLLEVCAVLVARNLGPSFAADKLQRLLAAEVRWQTRLEDARRALPPSQAPAAALLLRTLREKREESVTRLFRGLELAYSPGSVRGVRVGLLSADARVRGRALELLHELLRPEHRDLLLPALERRQEQRVASAKQDGDSGVQNPWLWLLEQSDAWLKACALVAGAEHFAGRAVGLVESLTESVDPVVRESATWAWQRMNRTASPEA